MMPLSSAIGMNSAGWIKPRDWTTLFQWYLGTTNVTAATDPVGYAADQSGRGNNCINAYALGRPIAAIVSSRNCIDFDGADVRLPERFLPDPAFLAWHRENVFEANCH